MDNIYGKDWLVWVRYTITLILIAICAGVFLLAAQDKLTTAIQDISSDRQAAAYNHKTHTIHALCKVGDYEWKYSTDLDKSDIKDVKLTDVRVWKSGYIGMQFEGGAVVVQSSQNCVVSASPKYPH